MDSRGVDGLPGLWHQTLGEPFLHPRRAFFNRVRVVGVGGMAITIRCSMIEGLCWRAGCQIPLMILLISWSRGGLTANGVLLSWPLTHLPSASNPDALWMPSQPHVSISIFTHCYRISITVPFKKNKQTSHCLCFIACYCLRVCGPSS